jgi:alanine racemase
LTSVSAAAQAASTEIAADRFDPWLEVDAAALRKNVRVVSGLANKRPILAVIKNNAYGLGLTTVASVLDPMPQIKGFAVVKAEAAIALRDAGIRKPVLLMGLFSDKDGEQLLRRNVSLSICTDDAASRIIRASKKAGKSASAHIYLDTGMSRMGIPYHRAMPALNELRGLDIEVEGTFTGFTEESDFDHEQLGRFIEITDKARANGVELGSLHAASSHAVFNYADAHLDQVRPGIALFGAYPSDFESERTIPVGHTDGMPREAVNGAHVVVNGSPYPAIGAVSASHTIIEVGEERKVDIGDVATVLGPDHPTIHPNQLADSTGTSVYDALMHLNPTLPKVLVQV